MPRVVHLLPLPIMALMFLPGCDAVGVFEGQVDDAPASTGDETGGSLSPFLVNGQIDHGHPSVGLLRSSVGNCTATLVGSRTVLTAAHCVGGSSTRFTVGGKDYYAAAYVPHPNCRLNIPQSVCSQGNTVENDVALVLLQQAVSNVTPSPISTKAPWVGQQLVLVGFGKTSESGGSGTKRMGTNTVGALTATQLRFLDTSSGVANLCNGDSGGPSFGVGSTGEEVVVGVHSTKNGTCGNGGTDMRVDAFEQWLVAQSGGDVRVAGQAAPNAPSTPAPATGNAGEGDSCASQGCLAGLRCTQFKKADGSILGRYCLEECSNPGGADPVCDGSEVCTASGSSAICFAANRPGTGYANIETQNGGSGGTPPPPPDPTATEGQSCAKRGCVPGLVCTTVHTLFFTNHYCMEPCQQLGADPACDGGEVCVKSPDNNLVCFLSSGYATGYTHVGDDPPPSSGSSWGTCTYSGLEGVCQSTSQGCAGGYVSNLCPGPADIKCCLPSGGSTGGAPSASCGTSLETAAYAALNTARGQNGRAALGCDSKALAAARAHSQDMCSKGFTAHTGSDGSTLSDRLSKAGASFSSASESLAKGFSSGSAVINGWMGSAGNKQLLIDTRWKRSAVGVVNCGGTNIWTAIVLY